MSQAVIARWRGARSAAALAVLAAAACASEPVVDEPVVRPIKTMTLAAAGGGAVREYPGTVQAAQDAEMAFEVAGRIVDFPVDEGERVERGALLARLDPRDYEAALAEERAREQAARAEYERFKSLHESGVVAKQELETRKRDYDVARARAETAGKAFEEAKLVAPFAGQVARKLVKDFANVQAKQPVVVLQDDSSFEVVVNVPERDWARGQPGRSLDEITATLHPRVSLTSRPDQAFPARIKEVATTADPISRTFAVTLAFARPAEVTVLPGMTAKVTITAPAARGGALRIPTQAVLSDEGGAAVWVVDPTSMRVRRAPVEVGELVGADVEVRSGLTGDETIAVSGVHQLRDGMQVRRLAQ
jgi:RND family efflux transporter MFP subunit